MSFLLYDGVVAEIGLGFRSGGEGRSAAIAIARAVHTVHRREAVGVFASSCAAFAPGTHGSHRPETHR